VSEPAQVVGTSVPGHLPWRRGIARILYSPAGRFRTVVFQAGQTRRFGRDERAEVRIADPALRGVHFELYFDGLRFHAKRLAPDGSLAIDGQAAPFGEIHNGGYVVAGATTLRLYVERTTRPPERDGEDGPPFGDERPGIVAEVVATLGPAREKWRLYGVFDAARDPRVRTLLNEGIDEHASLYEGAEGAVLDEVAPMLVRFAPDSRLLERLVDEGWGRAWGVFARSDMSAKDVRRHFRRYLMVMGEGARDRMYFRFYDPRVLRDFFSIATPRQRSELTMGLDGLFVETEAGALSHLVGPQHAAVLEG
jgi:hypothetical protein